MLTKTIKRIFGFLGFLVADPGQVQYLLQWLPTLRRTTLECRTPWLPYRVLDRIEATLSSTSTVFEYGGGGSTAWFADHRVEVVTVEHDVGWHAALAAAVADQPKVIVKFGSDRDGFADYVNAISSYPDDHFDVVVVDGRERVRCFESAMPKVRPGGLLVLDDTNRERYAGAFSAASEWPHVTYRGLTPSKTLPGVTTIWQRPNN